VKVLLSAYACEPHKGSEPGVGWRWALEISKLGHEVWVLTRRNNRRWIEGELSTMEDIKNVHFFYYDLPKYLSFWKRGGRGVYLYYFLWQLCSLKVVLKLHNSENFDQAHLITFGGIRQPNFLRILNVPYIVGPIGGAEKAPWRLRCGYGPRGWLLDAIRDIANIWIKVDPLFYFSVSKASSIYTKTKASLAALPKRYQTKAKCRMEIGIDRSSAVRLHRECSQVATRFLYVGRLVYWKGMHLGLAAFKEVLLEIPDARLSIVGVGPDEKRWKKIAVEIGIDKNIDWRGWVPHQEIKKIYLEHDVFLFPSLHDSSGNVVLEALSFGLPIVCFNLGGPGEIVDSTCGIVVEAKGITRRTAVRELATGMLLLSRSAKKRTVLATGGVAKADKLAWHKVVKKLYPKV